MPSITVRNVPDEIHRALKVRAARHGRSTEAEIRYILEESVRPEKRLGLGSLLMDIGQSLQLSEEEARVLESARSDSPARSAHFE